jgi:hypothetical protein
VNKQTNNEEKDEKDFFFLILNPRRLSSMALSSDTDSPGINEPKPLYKPSVSFIKEDHMQQQVQQHQLRLHKQNSIRYASFIKKNNDLESKINRT